MTRCETGTCGLKCCLYLQEIIYLLSAWKKKIWLLWPLSTHLEVYDKILLPGLCVFWQYYQIYKDEKWDTDWRFLTACIWKGLNNKYIYLSFVKDLSNHLTGRKLQSDTFKADFKSQNCICSIKFMKISLTTLFKEKLHKILNSYRNLTTKQFEVIRYDQFQGFLMFY